MPSGVFVIIHILQFMGRKKVPDQTIIESYSRLNNVWEVAKEVGLCGQSVHERLVKLGIKLKNPKWSQDDQFYLIEHYTDYLLRGKLSELAKIMNRTKPFICRKAKKIGLTDISRPKSIIEGFKPTKVDWGKIGHPKGFSGKKHTPEAIRIISEKSKQSQEKINNEPGRREGVSKKMIYTKMEKGNLVVPRVKQTWKAGWREIGGQRKYFRSKWEANYARYLEFLKAQGQILNWEHEAEVFWFDGIKRGCVSYLPDFRITEINKTLTYHEVKGWMDERSKTKLKRMKIYHPNIVLKVIDAKWFKENNKTLTSIIYGWEV